MLTEKNFTIEHIRDIQNRHHADPLLIERVIYAFGLLESLARVELPFIFKGGTCLMLVLKQPMRFSTDIDIIVEPGNDILVYMTKASMIFPFIRFEEQIRIGKNNIEKKHFKFYYYSPVNQREFHIILDVVFEKCQYSALIHREISNDFLITEEPGIFVTLPSANCILGDKLTAFAPYTTGIPFGIGKEMEIMKKLYDVITLLEVMDNFQEVSDTFYRIVATEIKYRGLEICGEDVLNDTIESAACIISRGAIDSKNYILFMKGIKEVRNHIFRENYSGERAAIQSCKVLYFAACLLTKKDKFLPIINLAQYDSEVIALERYRKLSFMKKVQMEAFAYLVEASKILADIS